LAIIITIVWFTNFESSTTILVDSSAGRGGDGGRELRKGVSTTLSNPVGYEDAKPPGSDLSFILLLGRDNGYET